MSDIVLNISTEGVDQRVLVENSDNSLLEARDGTPDVDDLITVFEPF